MRVILLSLLLTGCVITTDNRADVGNLKLDVDCEKNQVFMELDLDKSEIKDRFEAKP